jgi:hypothetical protein
MCWVCSRPEVLGAQSSLICTTEAANIVQLLHACYVMDSEDHIVFPSSANAWLCQWTGLRMGALPSVSNVNNEVSFGCNVDSQNLPTCYCICTTASEWRTVPWTTIPSRLRVLRQHKESTTPLLRNLYGFGKYFQGISLESNQGIML